MPGGRSTSPERFLLIGNPENRRVTMFVEAVARAGLPPPLVLSHQQLLDDPELLLSVEDRPLYVRVDSVGENAAVERELLALGYEAARKARGVWSISPSALAKRSYQRGEILCPRQAHFGFERYMKRLEQLFAKRPSWQILNPPASVLELFDKRLTSRRYEALGIPVPDPLGEPTSAEELRQMMRDQQVPTVFVKLSCSSSASCLAFYKLNHDGRSVLMTTMRKTRQGWFNSLRLQRIEDATAVDGLLGLLLPQGCQVERAIPKARLDDAYFDCRVLVVDGEPAFTVVRQNSHPITNLHLGGWRGDLEHLRQAVSDAAWRAALDSCKRVWAAHRCFQVGVDLLFTPGYAEHRIIEANAFGDLLPNLQREGKSVYEWQIHRLQTRSASSPALAS